MDAFNSHSAYSRFKVSKGLTKSVYVPIAYSKVSKLEKSFLLAYESSKDSRTNLDAKNKVYDFIYRIPIMSKLTIEKLLHKIDEIGIDAILDEKYNAVIASQERAKLRYQQSLIDKRKKN